MALTDKLTNIADAIRGKTGSKEPLTLEGMAAAIAGIQAGGGGASEIYMAKITLAENVNKFTVTHNLGTEDILFALCFAEDLDGLTPGANIMASSWLNTRVTVRYGSLFGGGYQSLWTYDPTNTRAQPTLPTNGQYWSSVLDENTFLFERGSGNSQYLAGLTYTIIIMAASAFAPTEV